jgi:hypothetical protein
LKDDFEEVMISISICDQFVLFKKQFFITQPSPKYNYLQIDLSIYSGTKLNLDDDKILK